MFDDLILLAKGGLTVYHGSVKKVEEYFTSLGITVPDRVNPPDYFIDILEGIVKPGKDAVDYKELPLRWMVHNGYEIPPDMQQNATGIDISVRSSASNSETNPAPAAAAAEGQSFAGELWQDMKCTVELKRDKIQHNFAMSNDLSNRQTAGVLLQYRYFLGR